MVFNIKTVMSAAALAYVTDARKSLVDSKGHKVNQAFVRECEEICIFKD